MLLPAHFFLPVLPDHKKVVEGSITTLQIESRLCFGFILNIL